MGAERGRSDGRREGVGERAGGGGASRAGEKWVGLLTQTGLWVELLRKRVRTVLRAQIEWEEIFRWAGEWEELCAGVDRVSKVS